MSMSTPALRDNHHHSSHNHDRGNDYGEPHPNCRSYHNSNQDFEDAQEDSTFLQEEDYPLSQENIHSLLDRLQCVLAPGFPHLLLQRSHAAILWN